MGIGLTLFLFAVALILVSISPLKSWRLDKDQPLDVDDLKWPAAGYGSATVSLNGLFGAYSATLLLVGYTCFLGIIAGVVSALFLLNFWVSRYSPSKNQTRFQSVLYSLQPFESPALSKLFWFLLIVCQVGLATSELLLVHNVFFVGTQFSEPHAVAASLSIACIAYYYCLFGGYHALFRTDALQYVFVVVMGLAVIFLLWRIGPLSGGISGLSDAVGEIINRSPPKKLLPNYPRLRLIFEILGGFALGVMPVLAAPDAWKRVLTIARRYPFISSGSGPSSWFQALRRPLQIAPVRLFIATALPMALILPMFLLFREGSQVDAWYFPIQELFTMSPAMVDGFLLLGMIAAFMSTFDSAHLSATHILLNQGSFSIFPDRYGLTRFRLLFAGSFIVSIGLFVSFLGLLPNPYAIGAFLVTPFAIVSGTLIGTSFGQRKASNSILYVLVIVCAAWVLLSLEYLASAKNVQDPYLAVPLVFFGCCVFFIVMLFARWLSTERSPSQAKPNQ